MYFYIAPKTLALFNKYFLNAYLLIRVIGVIGQLLIIGYPWVQSLLTIQ